MPTLRSSRLRQSFKRVAQVSPIASRTIQILRVGPTEKHCKDNDVPKIIVSAELEIRTLWPSGGWLVDSSMQEPAEPHADHGVIRVTKDAQLLRVRHI